MSRLLHSDITAGRKESLKKLCLILKLEICCFENFLSHIRYCLVELAEKDTREIFHGKFSKINIIFLTNVSILRILSLILEKTSEKMYVLLLQLLPWPRYIE